MSEAPRPDPADAIGSFEELRWLAGTLRGLDRAAAATQWDDGGALQRAVDEARSELALHPVHPTAGGDIAALGASEHWQLRAEQRAHDARSAPPPPRGPAQAEADAVVAIGLARIAVAEAVLAVHRARLAAGGGVGGGVGGAKRWTRHVRSSASRASELGGRVAAELRHIAADSPRSVLARTVVTLGISLSLVAVHHLTGAKRYDLTGLTLYLFSAVVGSVVCTNTLCFEAERVRAGLVRGEWIWQILVAKNIAMAALVTAAGLPVVAALTLTAGANPVVLVDQLVTMVFIWLGVGNVLSVVYPLRYEPMSARLHDGTWKPFLFTFAISYGVGLSVNLSIYWRLWAREAANARLAGGAWVAFLLVLASATFSWLLLTVLAAACSRQPGLRRKLSRELVAYRKRPKRPATH